MFSTKFCGKRRFQICLKCLIIIMVFGIYFIILLRESIAALEVTNRQQNNLIEVTHESNHYRKHNLHHHHHHHYYYYNQRKYLQQRSTIDKATLLKHRNNGEIATDNNHTTASSKIVIGQQHRTTINPIYEYSEEENAAAENDFNQRKVRLMDTCAKLDIYEKHPPNAWEFFISPGHGLAWCNVFKAASSTWMYYFNILAGYDVNFLQRTRTSPLELARRRFPRPSKNELSDALSTSLSFLIVREPFERLLSAYRNKLEGYRNRYYKILGEQIVKKFRKLPRKSVSGPTFKEFLLFLIENHKAGERFDEHWSPIYTFCTPCSINYTLIAKVETFKRDSDYIIRQAGLETLLLNKLPQKKIKSITNQSNSSTKNYISKYFSQIDINTLMDLLDVYGPDFELFGYNSTKYFDIVQPAPIPIGLTTHQP